MASSSGRTPLFLRALPQRTGMTRFATVALRSAFLSSVAVTSWGSTDLMSIWSARPPPDCLLLALDAGDGIEYNNASVQDTEAAFDFDGEVHVAGGVYDIDHVVPPAGGSGGGGDGDPPLPLLRHPVHDGSTSVHLTDLVGASRVEQDALGDRGLAGIYVRDDPNIPE